MRARFGRQKPASRKRRPAAQPVSTFSHLVSGTDMDTNSAAITCSGGRHRSEGGRWWRMAADGRRGAALVAGRPRMAGRGWLRNAGNCGRRPAVSGRAVAQSAATCQPSAVSPSGGRSGGRALSGRRGSGQRRHEVVHSTANGGENRPRPMPAERVLLKPAIRHYLPITATTSLYLLPPRAK